MNTLVSHHSLSLAYTSRFCVGMLAVFDTDNPETVDTNEISSLSTEALSKSQQDNLELKPLIQLLEQGTIPSEKQQSQKLLLVQLCYMVVDKILYFVDPKLPH